MSRATHHRRTPTERRRSRTHNCRLPCMRSVGRYGPRKLRAFRSPSHAPTTVAPYLSATRSPKVTSKTLRYLLNRLPRYECTRLTAQARFAIFHSAPGRCRVLIVDDNEDARLSWPRSSRGSGTRLGAPADGPWLCPTNTIFPEKQINSRENRLTARQSRRHQTPDPPSNPGLAHRLGRAVGSCARRRGCSHWRHWARLRTRGFISHPLPSR